jgi:adenylate cyclase
VVAGLDQIMTRNVGCFLLPGKSQPLTIFEIAGSADVPPAGHYQELHSLFAEALHCFSRRQWQQARALFQRCLKLEPDDGPSRFYQDLCQRYQDDPPAPPWRGVVQITLK